MSAYDNVVVGKLKLKDKALHVKAGGIKKKKKKQNRSHDQLSLINQGERDTLFCSQIETIPKIKCSNTFAQISDARK